MPKLTRDQIRKGTFLTSGGSECIGYILEQPGHTIALTQKQAIDVIAERLVKATAALEDIKRKRSGK